MMKWYWNDQLKLLLLIIDDDQSSIDDWSVKKGNEMILIMA